MKLLVLHNEDCTLLDNSIILFACANNETMLMHYAIIMIMEFEHNYDYPMSQLEDYVNEIVKYTRGLKVC